jgi:serine protease Do
VRIQEVTPDIAESLGLHSASGAMVAGVTDDGPAAKAKIRNGDIILKFNGHDVKEMHNLPLMVAETAIGQTVPLEIWRNGKQQEVQVTVAELPDDVQQASANTPAKPAAPKPAQIAGLGITLSPLTDDLRSKFQIGQDQKGVVVTNVSPNSAAADRGLHPGDVIVEVQQEAVNTPGDVQSRVDNVRAQNRRSVLMLIQGQNGLRWVPLPLDQQVPGKPG